MTFVSIADYEAPVFSGEIGRYESFAMVINRSKGYKRTLLTMRLRKIRVRIIGNLRTKLPSKKNREWCF